MTARVKRHILYAAALLALAAAAVAIYIASAGLARGETPRVSVPAPSGRAQTLRVVADVDYDPYSFFDEEGQPSGHDVELIYAVAARMDANVDLQLLPWREAMAALRSGEADLILGLRHEPAELPGFSLSLPIVSDPFVAYGLKPFQNLSELYDKRLAALDDTGMTQFIRPFGLEDKTTVYGTVSEAFQSVLDGQNDYAVARYSVGRRAVLKLNAGFQEIRAFGPTLSSGSLCVGLRAGRDDLLKRVNSALVGAVRDGTVDALRDKWLGNYVQTATPGEFFRQNAARIAAYGASALVVLLACFILINSRRMKKRQRALRFKAEHDPLTGLVNRATAEARIRAALSPGESGGPVHALFVVDIDNFKLVNDSLGHMQGDSVLVDLSDSLKRLFRADDVVARLGGDEFMVFMRDCRDREIVSRRASQVCMLFENTYAHNDIVCNITASVGIALFPENGHDFTTLYKRADAALYLTKERGKNGYTLYDGTVGKGYRAGRE